MVCEHCADAESLFTERAARRDLKRYRRKGPTGITRELLHALREQDVAAGTLLDIGGGVGTLQHELLHSGLAHAVHVDASRAYLEASAREAERQGHGDRVEQHHGDFVQLADNLVPVDVVTLDRVVCCYPDMPALVRASAAKAQRLYALSYPRVRWLTRLGRRLGNAWFRVRGSSFRTYLHPPAEIEAHVERNGFRPVASGRTLLWHAAVYRRVNVSASDPPLDKGERARFGPTA
jgi:magnesium-protoporphyrin O-methyltransferase